MPFLGPLIVAWIILAVAVMACYFLVVARSGPPSDEPWVPFGESRGRESSTTSGSSPRSTAWVRPTWGEPVIEPPPPSNLPAYDMENFPTDHWRSTGSPAADDVASPDPRAHLRDGSRDDPRGASRDAPWDDDEPWEQEEPWDEDEPAEAPAPWVPPPRATARPAGPPPGAGSGYDMENFPADRWDSLAR